MFNLLLQISKNWYDFKNDINFESMNHYWFNTIEYYNENIRIDFSYKKSEPEVRCFNDSNYFVAYIWYILFKEEDLPTVNKLIWINKNNINNNIISWRFIYIVYDKINKKCYLSNDRFWFIELFVYNDENNIILSTEPKWILNSNLIKNKKFSLDYSSVSNYLSFDYILWNKYYLNEIKRVDPAYYFTIDVSNFCISKCNYWTPNYKFSDKLIDDTIFKMKDEFKNWLELFKKKYKWNYICDISWWLDSRYIYLNDDDIKFCMTLWDKDNIEYKYVEDTLKLKNAELINIPTKLSNIWIEWLEKIFEITDWYISLSNPHNYLIVKEYLNHSFHYNYDWFAWDAVLWNTYLNFFKDFYSEFWYNRKYNKSDYNIWKFNYALLDNNFKEKLDDYNDLPKYIDSFYTKYKDPRIWLMDFKFQNRWKNRLSTHWNFESKLVTKVYPFFYYPFYDIYVKIRFDELRCRKAQYKMYKLLDKKYHNLWDDFFVIPFKYPHKLRLFVSWIYLFLYKFNFVNSKKNKTFHDDIVKPENCNLKEYIRWKLLWFNVIKINVINKEYIERVFNDNKLLKANFDNILRLLNLVYFFEKYEYKIIL